MSSVSQFTFPVTVVAVFSLSLSSGDRTMMSSGTLKHVIRVLQTVSKSDGLSWKLLMKKMKPFLENLGVSEKLCWQN